MISKRNWINVGRKSGLAPLLCLFALVLTSSLQAKQVLRFSPEHEDMTPVVRAAIEAASDSDLKIVFEKGIYKFLPDYAAQKYCYVTNHGNGLKNIAFLLEGFDSVEVVGNDSELIFHGQMLPFQFEGCGKVTVEGLTIDWDIPFTFLGEVVAVNPEEQWRDIKPFTEGFSWTLRHGQILFPNVDGFNYMFLGSTLAFDAEHKRVAHGALDLESRPRKVERRPGGILRIHEPLRQYPAVGTLLSSKGDREHDRYAPAFEFKSSNEIELRKVVVHHALGMGFLFERSENISMFDCGVYLREGVNRVISSTADATHFCNCRGDILIENCRFENMLDDGTNVHGTYMVVDSIIDEKTVRVGFHHFEQSGFEFAGEGDEIWFVHQPSPERASEGVVESVNVVNERFVDLSFKEALPVEISEGDLVENKTWNPTFTMRGCVIRDHRARNIVLKTPEKILIEDNDFSSMMSSIFFRGESFFWYESGGVKDVLIRNNRFEYCAYSGMEHAVMWVTPRLGKTFDQTALYDRNIRFENNSIKNFDRRIVRADRVDGLVISGNTIEQTKDAPPLHPDAHMFEFDNCRDVVIQNNVYKGDATKGVKADKITQESLSVERNKGF